MSPHLDFNSGVWDDVLRQLEAELPAFSIDTWLRPLVAVRDGDGIRLRCPSSFHLDRVREHFLPTLAERLNAVLGRRISIAMESTNGCRAPAPVPTVENPNRPSHPAPRASSAARNRFPPQTFDSFVVGPGNALAREGAVAMARPGELDLRLLYLASEAGMGKTHLARAVINEARRNRPQKAVYLSAESFTNEFMTAIRTKQTSRFKQRFRRECDLLIVEDIRFLEGKKATQLELFHTLQHLLDAGGHVVLTGDRLPLALTGLDERLRSQISGGLVAQIGTPDAEVRRNILRSKAAAGGVKLPPPCLELLVAEVRGSVRDLENVLIQLVTTAVLLKRSIDLGLTREALAKKYVSFAQAPRQLDPAAVIAVVSSFFKTTSEALSSRSRKQSVLMPRQLAMYLCHRYTDASLTEIGRAFKRDHPAVKNAIARVERQVLERAPLRYQLEALTARLKERTGDPTY
jgi:chromosomal replication initiator protein